MSNKRIYIQYFLMRIFRIFVIFIILLFILSLFLFTFVDRSHVADSEAYQKTMQGLNEFNPVVQKSNSDTTEIGWAKINITPSQPVELAGYGARKQKVYKVVHDSIFMRAFVFKNGMQKHAIISADLLIFPPEVINALKGKMPEGFSLSNTYFSATHSHSSIGHWQPGFVGDLFAGSYDPNIVDDLAEQVVSVIKMADQKTEKANISYQKLNHKKFIRNRLVKEKGIVDPWLRVINIEQVNGKKAILFSYAAHATCLSYSYAELSGDYPAQVIQNLEESGSVDFVAYMAGAVASMSPEAPGLGGFEKVAYIAESIQHTILANQPDSGKYTTNSISFNDFHFDPGKAQFKVTEDLRVRDWVFNQLFGKNEMEITSMKIGKLLLVGVPCDFSGELVAPLEKIAKQKGMELIITSFNGGYAGYVTKDEWYDLNKYETRTMNWYGHETGKYFTDAIEKIILGYAKNY